MNNIKHISITASTLFLVSFLFFFVSSSTSFAANRYWVGTNGANTNTTASWSSTAPAAETAPSYRSVASVEGSATTITINKPSGTTTDDILVAYIFSENTADPTSVPTGWNLVTSATNQGVYKVWVYYKRAGGSEGASYQWQWAGSTYRKGFIAAVSGGITSGNPIDTSSIDQANSGATFTAPSITTTVTNTLLMAGFFNVNDNNINGPTSGGWSMFIDQDGLGYYGEYLAKTATGSTGTVAVTSTDNGPWFAAMIAIKPAPAGCSTPSGASVPGSGDVAIFDADCDNNATIDANLDVQGLDMQSGYSGTITQSSTFTVTTGSSGWTQATGSFAGGSGAITMNATNSTNGDFSLTGGTFTSTSGTLTFHGNTFTVNGGTFTHNSGTVDMNASSQTNKTYTGSATFNALTFTDFCCGATTNTFTTGTTYTTVGTLTYSGAGDGSGMVGPGGISAQGNITTTGKGAYNYTNTTFLMTINGTGTQTITGETGDEDTNLPSTEINKASGSLGFATNTKVRFMSNAFTYTAGTVNAGTSTVIFTSANNSSSYTNTINITGSLTLNNLKFYGICCTGNTIPINTGTMVVTGTLSTGDDGTGQAVTTNGPGTINAQGSISHTSAAGWAGNIAITLSGTTSQTITASGTNFPTGTFTVNKSSGTATLASNLSVNSSGQDFILSSGIFNIAGFNLTVNDNFTISEDGTLQLQGAETVSTIDTMNGSMIFNGNGNAGSNTYTITNYSSTFRDLTINSTDGATDTFQLGATIDVNRNFANTAGTFTLTSTPYSMTVAGNFANTGTFTAGTGTVTFDTASTTSTISGSTSFYNLVSTTARKNIIFTAGTTQTVTNNLTFTGADSGQLLSLTSTSAGSQWNINDAVGGTTSVSYVVVKDSNATGQTIAASTSYDSGNNTNWTFSGQPYSAPGQLFLKGGLNINGGIKMGN